MFFILVSAFVLAEVAWILFFFTCLRSLGPDARVKARPIPIWARFAYIVVGVYVGFVVVHYGEETVGRLWPPESLEVVGKREFLASRLAVPPGTDWSEGVAVLVAWEVSARMAEETPDPDNDGLPIRKLEIARRRVLEVARYVERHSRGSPHLAVQVGVAEFSGIGGGRSWDVSATLAAPDAGVLRAAALRPLRPEGWAHIGNALIKAKGAVDRSGMRRRHIIVVTDGRGGDHPSEVAVAMAMLAPEHRASLTFVAWNVEALDPAVIVAAGGVILAATDAPGLEARMEELLTGRIQVEREAPAEERR